MKQRPKTKKKPLTTGHALGLGLELSAAIVGLTLLGYWLDQQYDTAPYWVLAGVLLGLVGGVYNVMRQVM